MDVGTSLGASMSRIEIDGFLDIETSRWDEFAMGGLHTRYGEFEMSTDEDEYFDSLLSHGGNVWAWNGGLFDFLWFLQVAKRRKLTARISNAGTRLTRIECAGLVLRDAVALVPTSLAKAAPIANREVKKDTGLVCSCERPCGGYCAIKRSCFGMERWEIDSLAAYLKIDCEVGYQIVDTIIGHAETHGYQLKGTIGGTAWATASTMLEIPPADWIDSREYNDARAGYYGGRVTVGRIQAESGFRYDINSAYPAALSNLELPTGERFTVGTKLATRAYLAGKEGIYGAIVNVPKNLHLPPLPMRTSSGRVTFPIGRLCGSWTGLELRYAEEHFGVKIERLCTGIVWKDTKVIFREFMNNVYDVRHKVGKNTGLGTWQKFLGNSFSGKLAQSPESERIVMYPEKEPVLCPGGDCEGKCRKGKCCDHECSGRCKAWKQVDRDGLIWAQPFYKLPECGYVHWAAYLTAWTRVTWLHFASQFGNRFLYGDTDSVYAMDGNKLTDIEIGSKLGTWAFEGSMSRFDCLGPKAYKFFCGGCAKHPNGDWHVKLKGVARATVEDYDLFRSGGTIHHERGVMGFRSAAKNRSGRLFLRKHITRTSKSDGIWFGDRRLDRGSLWTRPVTYKEQCDRER
jgi:hypothetical protein